MARQSSITFYKNVNLDIQSGNTYHFANRTTQATFFNNKAWKTVTGTSYQREGRNYVRVYETMAQLLQCDYLSFINPDYENKRFFCFIVGVTYINDKCQEVEYQVDLIQTWLLDLQFKPCMIDRNHPASDALFSNLLPETFDMGEALVNQFYNYTPVVFSVIFQATFDIYGWIQSNFQSKPLAMEYIRGDLFDGYSMVGVDVYISTVDYAGNGSAFAVILEKIFTGAGGVTMDDFTNIWLYPGSLLGRSGTATCPGTRQDIDSRLANYWKVADPDKDPINLGDLPQTFDGYTPKNNKIFSYPYCFIHVSNNVGSAVDYRFERFAPVTEGSLRSRYSAWIQGTTQNEAKMRLSPRNYAGVYDVNADDLTYHGYLKLNLEESIDSQSFPIVSLIGDAYNIYYAQNRNKITNFYDEQKRSVVMDTAMFATGQGSSVMSQGTGKADRGFGAVGKGAEYGQGTGAVAAIAAQAGAQAINIVGKYENTIKAVSAQQDDLRKAPRTASGLQSEGLAFQAGYKGFLIEVRTIDSAHAKMIDDFWTMYGYPIRHIGNPGNLMNNRPSWTYIKTAGCSLGGQVPEYVKNMLEQLFDAGLTFWNPAKVIGDYSQSNI